jgi:glycosyltransferase involved in cell wall biosynthesis
MENIQKLLEQQERPLNVIYVSSYIPRKCGIATYTKDLTSAINLLNAHSLAEILVTSNPDQEIEYPWEAKFKITQEDLTTYLAAAAYVNQSNTDIVSLQHEFGLFGGEDGEYVLHFVEALTKPLITTFHTVTTNPSSKQQEILKRLADASEAIIVMMEGVADKLVKIHGISRDKIIVIPHGVPDATYSSDEKYKRKRQLSDRLVVGNINLLDPNKGIEYALEAVAIIAREHPEVMYIAIGQTHPEVLKREGEKYRNFLKKRVRELGITNNVRNFLKKRVRELGITNNVRFINEYLSLKEIMDWLKTFDMYITPYLEPEQVTSGALAYAIGAGKACIATEYLYAKEVLADGRGVLVPFRDSRAIANAVLDLYQHPEKKRDIEKRAYKYGRLMTWPNVAKSTLNLFRTIIHGYHKLLPQSSNNAA